MLEPPYDRLPVGRESRLSVCRAQIFPRCCFSNGQPARLCTYTGTYQSLIENTQCVLKIRRTHPVAVPVRRVGVELSTSGSPGDPPYAQVCMSQPTPNKSMYNHGLEKRAPGTGKITPLPSSPYVGIREEEKGKWQIWKELIGVAALHGGGLETLRPGRVSMWYD